MVDLSVLCVKMLVSVGGLFLNPRFFLFLAQVFFCGVVFAQSGLLDPEFVQAAPPSVRPGCVQVVYLTTKGERYGSEYNLCGSESVFSFRRRGCRRHLEICCSVEDFFKHGRTIGWTLKRGARTPTDGECMQGLWAFADCYEEGPFYGMFLKQYLRDVCLGAGLGERPCLKGCPMISEAVVTRMFSRLKMIQWSLVDDADFEQAVETDKRARSEMFVRVPNVGIFHGVQKRFSLVRFWKERVLNLDSAFAHAVLAMQRAAKSSTKEAPLRLKRYGDDGVITLFCTSADF